ncbi:DUF397 domain-containing protein [Glycomyces sp. YM15]|uniref:DUF397 domain-containing protein n=1 Tax=Glycomyces sp. YM15 TaxID=2800446 RepID=UPI001964E3A6|nr:DUF397 domain-containing protein [Glycomyces sp. YM15]
MTTGVSVWRKSTRSGSGNNSNCVEVRRAWRKGSRSGADNNTNCVELALCSDDTAFHLRDSKLDTDSPVFDLSPKDLGALINAAG